jgi:hypothetical protein
MNEHIHTQIKDMINQLSHRIEPQALSPDQIWDSELESRIAKLSLTVRNSNRSAGSSSARAYIALMAGLHLWNDSLDASHSYAQQIEDDDTGSYWHGIMHRMEQDYSNSKYWFRLAGNHPVKLEMPARAAELLQQQTQLDSLPPSRIVDSLRQYRDHQGWSCDDFADMIKLQEHDQGTERTQQLLEQLQQLELRQLFYYTYNDLLNTSS